MPIRPRRARTWRVALTAPPALAPAVQDLLESRFDTVSVFETEGRGPLSLEAYAAEHPDRATIETQLAILAAAAGVAAPVCEIAEVPPADWVAQTEAAFPPIRCGRFLIHGSHDRQPWPVGPVTLSIDATMAFGTGEHPTTRGCLQAIEWLARRRRAGHALDLGCGSGILAIAIAKIWRPRGRIVASDTDPDAILVARTHCRDNRVAGRVHVVLADGVAPRAVRRTGGYDVIVANILARPLARMAAPVSRSLAPGGTLILSGLLKGQAAWVTAAYRRQGLHLTGRFRNGEWPTLIFRRCPHFRPK
ncbi:MAG: 50S ribosomal protein L11 methyltransferase [Rhodospirillaceae bacterium]|nr:50S ribosomal protein L11 methyltransferase [Rhodospirillaceae bacterium]